MSFIFSSEREPEEDKPMFGLKSGSWSLHSKTDSRWNCWGNSDAVGMFEPPQECKDKIEELKKTLGEPPDDLAYSYMKD